MNKPDDFLLERYELAMGRIREIREETQGKEGWQSFFASLADFTIAVDGYYGFMTGEGIKKAELKQLQEWNRRLYEDILPVNYEDSFANPTYAVKQLGAEYGPFFSVLTAELRSMILPAAEGKIEELLIRMELLVEVYGACEVEWQECGKLPAYDSLQQILYWYVSDYSDVTEEDKIKTMVVAEESLAVTIGEEVDRIEKHNGFQSFMT